MDVVERMKCPPLVPRTLRGRLLEELEARLRHLTVRVEEATGPVRTATEVIARRRELGARLKLMAWETALKRPGGTGAHEPARPAPPASLGGGR